MVLEKTLESLLDWQGDQTSQSSRKSTLNSHWKYEYYIYSLLKLKLQYFGHLMPTANSLEKTDAGKDLGQKENR